MSSPESSPAITTPPIAEPNVQPRPRPTPVPSPRMPAEPATPAPPPTARPGTVRVSRVVLRRIDPWTVLKVSALFYLSMFVILLTAGVLLWLAAAAAGVIGNFESFMDSIGFTDFELLPGQILRTTALIGLVLVVAGTAGNVLMVVLYNLIGDVIGGVRITLADEDRRGRRV